MDEIIKVYAGLDMHRDTTGGATNGVRISVNVTGRFGIVAGESMTVLRSP